MKICKYKKHHHHKNLKLIVKKTYSLHVKLIFCSLMILSEQSNLIMFVMDLKKDYFLCEQQNQPTKKLVIF